MDKRMRDTQTRDNWEKKSYICEIFNILKLCVAWIISAFPRGKKSSVHLRIPNIHLKIKPSAPSLAHIIKIPTARVAEAAKIFCATFLCLLLVPVKLSFVFEKK